MEFLSNSSSILFSRNNGVDEKKKDYFSIEKYFFCEYSRRSRKRPIFLRRHIPPHKQHSKYEKRNLLAFEVGEMILQRFRGFPNWNYFHLSALEYLKKLVYDSRRYLKNFFFFFILYDCKNEKNFGCVLLHLYEWIRITTYGRWPTDMLALSIYFHRDQFLHTSIHRGKSSKRIQGVPLKCIRRPQNRSWITFSQA